MATDVFEFNFRSLQKINLGPYNMDYLQQKKTSLQKKKTKNGNVIFLMAM